MIMNKILKPLCLAAALLLAALPAGARITLSNLFTDHMVLQRDCPVPVWGTGMPRESVFVRLFDGEGENRRCIAKGAATIGENGRWCEDSALLA